MIGWRPRICNGLWVWRSFAEWYNHNPTPTNSVVERNIICDVHLADNSVDFYVRLTIFTTTANEHIVFTHSSVHGPQRGQVLCLSQKRNFKHTLPVMITSDVSHSQKRFNVVPNTGYPSLCGNIFNRSVIPSSWHVKCGKAPHNRTYHVLMAALDVQSKSPVQKDLRYSHTILATLWKPSPDMCPRTKWCCWA